MPSLRSMTPSALGALSLCVACLWSGAAQAQSNTRDSITELDLLTSTSGTTSTTTIVLVDIFICPPIRAACEVLSTTTELSWATSQSGSQRRAMAVFLRENAVGLSQEVALGAGPLMADLAALYGLDDPQGRRLGDALRARRRVIWSLLGRGHQLGDREVVAFHREVMDALAAR